MFLVMMRRRSLWALYVIWWLCSSLDVFKFYILLLLLLIFKFGALRPRYKHSSIERNLKKCVSEREVPNNGHQHLWKLEEISNKCDRWCRCERRRSSRERNTNWEEGWRNNNFTFFSVRSTTTTSSHRNKNVSLLNENERFVDVLEGELSCVYIKNDLHRRRKNLNEKWRGCIIMYICWKWYVWCRKGRNKLAGCIQCNNL